MVEIAVLERVADIFASLGDVDTALRRFIELVLEISGAPRAGIYLRDEQRGLFVRWRETPMTPSFDIPIPLALALFQDVDYQVLSLRRPDLEGEQLIQAAGEAGFYGSVSFAMRAGDLLVGVLGLGYPERPDPPEALLRLLAAVARFPAAAVQHARTQQVADRRARLAEALRRFGERALGTVGIEALHRVILETTQELTGANQASITRVEQDQVLVIAGVGKDERYVGSSAPAAAVREALSPKDLYLVRDVANADGTQLLVKLARKNNAGSFMALPLRHQSRLFGHLFAGCAEAFRFDDDEVEAMRILGSMSAAVLEQRSAQAEAEQQARRLAETIEHLPLLIEVFDRRGALVRSNAAARTMRGRLGVPGGSAGDLFPGLGLRELDGRVFDPAQLAAAAALRGFQLTPHEIVLTTPDGHRLATLLVAAAPIFAPDGSVESVVVGSQEVTKLHEVARAKDRFLRVAAHELRTPITALHATTQLVELDPGAFDDPERRNAVLARLRRQSVRLVKLVQQLLDSVQANAVELPLQRGPVDLVALVHDVVDITMPAAGPRAVIRADAPVIGRWDALRIEQVVTNLLANAARYSPAEGEVLVNVRADEGHALLQVSDRGIGIPAHQLDQLFTPFFRGANAQAHHGSGLGLGLHISQEIVRRHGGRIHVESQENSGTTFTVELPLD